MNTKNKQITILALAAVALIAVSAGAAAFVTKNQMEEKPAPVKTAVQTKSTKTVARKEQINWNQQQPAPQQQVRRCNDGNIVGAAIGGAAGGLVGHQFGKGKGRDLATIGGVIAGGTAGHQYIPTRGTLCP